MRTDSRSPGPGTPAVSTAKQAELPTPRTLLGERLVSRSVWVLALTGGVIGGAIVDALFLVISPPANAPATIAAGATTLTTTLMFGLALRVALRAPIDVHARTLASCAVLGWLNTPLTFVGTVLSLNLARGDLASLADPTPWPTAVVGGLTLGLVSGMPLGVVYGMVAAPLVIRLRRLLDRPTHDGAARVSVALGTTVMGAAAVALITVGILTPESTVACIALLLLGAFSAISGVIARRRAHCIHVALISGASPEFERIARSRFDEALLVGLCPLTDDVSVEPTHVLVRWVKGPGDGAYRTGKRCVPWAFID